MPWEEMTQPYNSQFFIETQLLLVTFLWLLGLKFIHKLTRKNFMLYNGTVEIFHFFARYFYLFSFWRQSFAVFFKLSLAQDPSLITLPLSFAQMVVLEFRVYIFNLLQPVYKQHYITSNNVCHHALKNKPWFVHSCQNRKS